MNDPSPKWVVLVGQGIRCQARRSMGSASRCSGRGAYCQPLSTRSPLRAWPADFPEDIAVQRRVPYESRADSVMYCKVLAELARERGWVVRAYDAKTVEGEATRILGERANVFRGPRATLGPPWSKDHRMALAATIVAA
jgi:hypothetical protein